MSKNVELLKECFLSELKLNNKPINMPKKQKNKKNTPSKGMDLESTIQIADSDTTSKNDPNDSNDPITQEISNELDELLQPNEFEFSSSLTRIENTEMLSDEINPDTAKVSTEILSEISLISSEFDRLLSEEFDIPVESEKRILDYTENNVRLSTPDTTTMEVVEIKESNEENIYTNQDSVELQHVLNACEGYLDRDENGPLVMEVIDICESKENRKKILNYMTPNVTSSKKVEPITVLDDEDDDEADINNEEMNETKNLNEASRWFSNPDNFDSYDLNDVEDESLSSIDISSTIEYNKELFITKKSGESTPEVKQIAVIVSYLFVYIFKYLFTGNYSVY